MTIAPATQPSQTPFLLARRQDEREAFDLVRGDPRPAFASARIVH